MTERTDATVARCVFDEMPPDREEKKNKMIRWSATCLLVSKPRHAIHGFR